MAYNQKVVYCGNVIEVYSYKENIIEGYANKIEKQKREQTLDVKLENFQRSIKRTKEKIRQLVNTNFIQSKSSFLTLTFKENITDYDVAFNYWNLFKKKVERRYNLKLQYLGVVEFQERGAIHFHICLFNVPFMEHDVLYDLWTSTCPGGVYIERIKDHDCDNVGAYITKYITKDNQDFFDNQYKGKKRYFKSRGLKEPYVHKYSTNEFPTDKENFDFLMGSYKEKVVYEYQSKPFDITKKSISYEQVPIVEKVEVVDLFGKVQSSENKIGNEVVKVKTMEGTEKLVERNFKWKEIEYKKTELSDCIVVTQQLHYKQIILNQNSNKRINGKYQK